MLREKKAKKVFFAIFFFVSFCSKDHELLPPDRFLEILEREFSAHYIFSDSVTGEDYLRTVRELDPSLSMVSTIYAKDYAKKLLEQNYQNNKEQAENYYKRFTYELLKFKKGQNIFITPTTEKLMAKHREENAAGAGIVLFEEKMGKFLIMDVIEGSPAYLADIRPGHYLHAVDEKSLEQDFLLDVVAKIKGKPKTKVKLTIHGNTYTLIRSTYRFQPVRHVLWKVRNKTVLYIQIRAITEGMKKQIESIIFESPATETIILDLRYVADGDIGETFYVADLFLDEGKTIEVVLKDRGREKLTTDANIIHTGKLIVLFQNKSSPFAFALAKLLANSRKTTVLGPDEEIPIYIKKHIPVNGDAVTYGSFYFTHGYVEIPSTTDRVNWIPVESFVSPYPLSDQPNADDPYHRKLVEILDR